MRTRSQSARQGYNAQARSWDKGLYAFMGLVLSTDHGQAVYPRRMATVEPVFGQLKHNRGFQRFLRRGRSAALSEW